MIPTGNRPWDLIALAGLAVLLVLHAVFAFAGWRDALRRRRTVLVGPFLWAFTTLLLGPFAAMGYWLVHAPSPADSALPGDRGSQRG